MLDRGRGIVRKLAAASLRNALRAFSGRSQGVDVVLAWESGVNVPVDALRGAQGVVVMLAGECVRHGRRVALRGAQGVDTGMTG